MTTILSYLLAGVYSGISGLYGATAASFTVSGAAIATCSVNGRLVECPSWLNGNFFSIIGLIFLAICILMLASMWIIFKKAGKPGWAAIVPIYNAIVMLKIAQKPTWWILLYLIPFVNIIISIVVIYSVALAFGKGGGFTLGLIFLPLIFYPILAFGDSAYLPGAQTAVPPVAPPPPATPQSPIL